MVQLPLFKVLDNKKMTEVVEVHFTLEKDLQELTEENMELIFGVEFVTSEFELQGLRIDSLCFDNETNSFVIIEYKRDSNFSVIDQGFAYLSLLLNNKAEFILKYNEVKNTFLKRNEIDWSQSRIIFVCRTFTTYQRKAIGFKDLPIELYEVKKFVNNLLLFNKIETQEKADSITRISQKNEIVRKVSSEIKVYSEQDHLKRANELTKSLYNELKTSIVAMSPEIQIKPKKTLHSICSQY